MRKHQQKKILELIQTLYEAHTEINRLFSWKNLTTLTQLLVESQEFVIHIGTYIENIEGEGTQTVALLEEYHEALYQASVELGNNVNHDGTFIMRLGKQLNEIESSVHNELKPNKIEVVFFPYKASMFDSLESIWLAAKDDPQCDTFVIPIPYFDRLPDGAFKQMKYEGTQYPDYVPVVDYRTYDIEARRPDIIFIHNPYDSGNYVTSVHPDYYSKRLKNYTDLLVYVPYFVVSDDVPTHFCNSAGVLLSDKVFLQSEKVRDIYVEVFNEFEEKHNCKGRFGNVESKFIASGSPKFDKVINSKPEDFTIPLEWQRLIEHPDGTSKKVVLYNTSVGAILQGNEQYIKKLRYVLNTFRKREDVILWWRPHPLNEATYGSMRPRLLSEYEQIIADYKREGWGIYDDTANLHRSICLSSMYFGDRSSLVALYQCVGKPIVIQEVNFTKDDYETTGLIFDSMVDDGKFLWFVSATYNALFKMDKNSWRLEFIGQFPNERLGVPQLYRGIAKCGDKLYFAPFVAKEAVVFNISLGRFDKILFRNLEFRLKVTSSLMFYNAISYKHFVYFLPAYYPAIVRLDTINGELLYYSNWLNSIENAINNPQSAYFYSYSVNNNEIILPCANANAIILFNMDTEIFKTYILGEIKNRYVSACYDGIDYWLCSITGSIFRWNQADNILTEVVSGVDDVKSKRMFIEIFHLNGYIWAFPDKADLVIKIDISDNTIEKVNVFESELTLKEKNDSLFSGNFIMAAPYGSNIFTHTGKSNHLIKYNTLTEEKREEVIIPDDKSLAELRAQYFYYNYIGAKTASDYNYVEIPNIHFGINEFLDFFTLEDSYEKTEKARLKQTELISNDVSKANASAGLSIYQNCKDSVL